MNAFIVICILGSLPMSMALICYECAALSGGCNDPFNATGSGVSKSAANTTTTYCKKVVGLGIAFRSADTSCSASKFVLNSGTACCQTNLCNEARSHYQIPSLVIVGCISILTKVWWA